MSDIDCHGSLRSFNAHIAADAVIERHAILLFAVQGLHVADEFLTTDEELFGFFLEVSRFVHFLCYVESRCQLLKQVALGSLVRMQFQTEWRKANAIKSVLHYVKCSHLLSDEKHTLPLMQSVGHHIGDGLRLACTWRTIQEERFPIAGISDGLKLRTVHVNRQCQICWFHLLIELPGIGIRDIIQKEFVFNQTLHDGTLLQLFCMLMYVIPHHELQERIETQRALLVHIPPLTICKSKAYRCKGAAYGQCHVIVYGLVILSSIRCCQIEHIAHVYAEALLQEFKDSDVENEGIFCRMYAVARATLSLHNLYR